MREFDLAYQQLNPAQQRAVTTIDGPVLVIAGPGTGKTQLLSMRVANILRQTDTDPASILCLTFTNKAAINMRERLISLVGNTAKDVMIKTFHSFAAELMNIYPDYFWNGARLSTAPDVVQIEVIQEILGKLPLTSPLAQKFAGNFTAGREVKNALRYAKEAGLTPSQLTSLIEANLAYIDVIEPKLVKILSKPLRSKQLDELQATINALPEQGLGPKLLPLQDLGKVIKESLDFAIHQDADSGKTRHTSQWKQRWLQSIEGQKSMHKERQRNIWWQHLAGVYDSYRSALHGRGYYDYSDMIVEVISQLQSQPDMLADVQERWLYVLIDEFQDTNAAQLQLAKLIAGHTDDSAPNLMAVGDDDQSIYKFNGAELSNMLSFQASYPSTQLIVLTDNYRSSQAVLDASDKIITGASDRLVNRLPSLNKQLVAMNPPAKAGQLGHLSYPNEAIELSELARTIANEHKSNQSIAVLARDHASLRRLAALLTNLKVPVSYEQQNNILEHPAVGQIQLICRLLVAINAGDSELVNVLLAQTLRAPMWQLTPEQLWQLAVAGRQASWLDTLLESKDLNLQDIAKWLLWLSQQASSLPLPLTLEYVIGLRAGQHLTSPLREYYLAKTKVDNDYLRALSAIRLLQATTHDFAKGHQASLVDFTSFIQLSMDSGEIIADESSFVTGERAVNLLTVHKAKGLEFDTVHIINAIDASWRPTLGGRACPANLPLQPVGDNQDDFARLMYVAATRAKQNLLVHSYRQDLAGKDVMATPLLSGVLDLKQVESKLAPITILEENLAWPHLNVADERRNLKDKLDNFSLSATALLDFLDVSRGGPETFFEKHLLSLPAARTASLGFGTAMHDALEFAQVATNGGNVSNKQVLARYQQTLTNQFLPPNEYQKFLSHGQDLLTKLLASDTFWLGKGDLAEQSLKDIKIGQATIQGQLDRIHIKDNDLTIIDYKTGRPLGSLTTRDQTKAITAWKHRSQLIFYALLVKNSPRFAAKNITGQMWYIEAARAKELIRDYQPSADELDTMAKLVGAVWPKIISLNLPDISNYSADYSGVQAFIEDLINGQI